MNILLCLPPTKVSNEVDLLRGIPGASLSIVAASVHPDADRSFRVPARRLPIVGSPERWTAALAWLSGLSELDPGPVDVVVSPELNNIGSVQANRLARRLGVPHVVTIFETLAPYPLFRVPPWRQISRSIVGSADGFVCLTNRALRHAVRHGCPEDRCVVVHPGVDVDRFTPRAEGRTEERVVLFVGELRPDKGVRTVIAACERLVERGVGLKLVVIGDGRLRAEVTKKARTADWLDYLGRRPRAEIPGHLQSARVFALAPKRRRLWEEQFGFGFVEAMATGLPIATTACGAVDEVVPDWNPIVPEGDVGSLAAAIEAALGDEGDEWGRKNRANVVANLCLHRQSQQLADTLGELISIPDPPAPRGGNG